jgi:phosphate acyltransferase
MPEVTQQITESAPVRARRFTVALDAMGGDIGPQVTVPAGIDAAINHDVRLLLIGDEAQIQQAIGERSYPAHLVEIVHAPEQVSMEDDAVSAVRGKRRASLPVGIMSVKNGEADAFISAGNTGAVVASAVVGLGRLPGVHRPGIAIPIATLSEHPLLLIDAGALVDPRPEHLWQHARLAAAYASRTMNLQHPRIGLVSNGAERGKGNALTLEAFKLLEADETLHFVGNVEARDISDKPCDVLVTDGFTGNVILKTGEGVMTLLESSFRREFGKHWYTGLLAMLLKPAIKRAGRALDYREYGGAPLLGVNGLVMIAHGGSDEFALKSAIRSAVEAGRLDLMSHMRQALGRQT